MFMQRIQKLLSNYGYCSRRKAEELIQAGRVKVNGYLISLGDKASETDIISVDDKLVEKPRKVYIMFHKPVGCVTAATDPKYKTVMDYVKTEERVFPIGRLDYNTSGLLLLTNDGDFANKVMHPRYETKKTYVVGLGSSINNEQITKIQAGVMLEDGKTSRAKVRKLNDDLIEITIHEGKNRIIRRMCQKLGLKVRFLQRIRIGRLSLGNLKPGRYRFLSMKEIEKIRN
jgi:23S rRNA pseudouridine2605 synthase